MNQLSTTRRAQVIAALVEGNSINATCRMLGVGKHTVLRLLEDAGRACAAFHDKYVRNVRVQDGSSAMKFGAFVGAKMKNCQRGAGGGWLGRRVDVDGY
jgi:N-formylglutamate amidohydrolase